MDVHLVRICDWTNYVQGELIENMFMESPTKLFISQYLDLCVELKKSHIAKEGLFQYRNMFQLVSFQYLIV